MNYLLIAKTRRGKTKGLSVCPFTEPSGDFLTEPLLALRFTYLALLLQMLDLLHRVARQNSFIHDCLLF